MAMIKTNDAEQKPLKRCLAKTRSGAPCQKHPVAGRTRCRLHGGLSTGPRSPEGKAACVAAHWKHGRRSKAYVETRKQIWAELRRLEKAMKTGVFLVLAPTCVQTGHSAEAGQMLLVGNLQETMEAETGLGTFV